MTKLLAIIKREYLQRVRSRMFIVWTILGPLMMIAFTVLPGFIFNIKTGEAVRISIVDQSGKMYERVRDSILRGREPHSEKPRSQPNELSNSNPKDRVQKEGALSSISYRIESYDLTGHTLDEARQELDARVRRNELDGYLVIPADILQNGLADYTSRNAGDVFTSEQLEESLSRAVTEQRMIDARIDQNLVHEMSRPVALSAYKISEGGKERDAGGSFYLAFLTGFLIYLTLIMYGQVIMAAIIEEKETRIAEVLFSSVRSFTLMMGKIIGVSLVALTQYAVWGLALAALALYGVTALKARGIDAPLPSVPPVILLYFILFFLLGYFIYATIYALVGSMVTTTQEGGQVSLPVIFLLVISFYLAFPVMRSPNSSFAFWVSMFPFFAPITMMVRIVTETPPFWQIALSFLIGCGTIIFLMWLTARIYRIGMLMYGKRASIPEVMRWIRQP